jgi:hypothetical protein
MSPRKARKQFFFEKKNQKTFALGMRPERVRRANQQSKSFLVLFFKKELLPCWLPDSLIGSAS